MDNDKTNSESTDSKQDSQSPRPEGQHDDKKTADKESSLPGSASTAPTRETGAPGKAGQSTRRPAATKPPQGKPPAKGRKKRGKFRLFLVLLILIAAGGAYLWYWQRDLVRPYVEPVMALFEGEGGNPITISSGDNKPAAEPEPAPPTQPVRSAPVKDDPSPPPVSREPGNQEVVESRLNQRIDRLNGRIADNTGELQALRDQVAEARVTLNSQQQRLEALSTTTREDWLLAEAEYLLRLANQRLLTEKESGNALSLMEAADDILRDLDDPDLFPVRKAVADDITALRIAGVVDREGLYLKLDALIGLIPQLEFPQRVGKQEEDRSVEDRSLPWYKELADNAWRAVKQLSGIVRVDRMEATVDPRLLPSERQLVRTSLRLTLEQAQLALMREEQAIYEAALQQALALVVENFAANRAAGVMIADLRELAGEKITLDLPAVSDSIRALKDYIDLWHNRRQVDQPSAPSSSPPVSAETENTGSGAAPTPAADGGEQP